MKIEGDAVADSTHDRPQVTPIEHLDTIMEENEDEEDMATASEPTMPQKKAKKGKRKKRGMPVAAMPVVFVDPNMNVDPQQMPMFAPGIGGQIPYKVAFLQHAEQHTKKSKKKQKNSKGHTVSFNSNVEMNPHPSTMSLPESKRMLTFSSLRQVAKQYKKSDSSSSVEGSFTGHATMEVETITKNSEIGKSIIKKSSSDSSVKRKVSS